MPVHVTVSRLQMTFAIGIPGHSEMPPQAPVFVGKAQACQIRALPTHPSPQPAVVVAQGVMGPVETGHFSLQRRQLRGTSDPTRQRPGPPPSLLLCDGAAPHGRCMRLTAMATPSTGPSRSFVRAMPWSRQRDRRLSGSSGTATVDMIRGVGWGLIHLFIPCRVQMPCIATC